MSISNTHGYTDTIGNIFQLTAPASSFIIKPVLWLHYDITLKSIQLIMHQSMLVPRGKAQGVGD